MRIKPSHFLTIGLLIAACTAQHQSLSGASRTAVLNENPDGVVGASGAECDIQPGAQPDVKTGTGSLVFDRLRMDRQTAAGVSVIRQYACAGRTYAMNAGETIELWGEWPDDIFNPKLFVDWGLNQGSDRVNCGSCLLKHAYPIPGLYRVAVTLDDGAGTSVLRVFFLDSRTAVPTPTPTPTPVVDDEE